MNYTKEKRNKILLVNVLNPNFHYAIQAYFTVTIFTAFSSAQSKHLHPIIDNKSYILPTSFIEAARETITEKGITSKHVLGKLLNRVFLVLAKTF